MSNAGKRCADNSSSSLESIAEAAESHASSPSPMRRFSPFAKDLSRVGTNVRSGIGRGWSTRGGSRRPRVGSTLRFSRGASHRTMCQRLWLRSYDWLRPRSSKAVHVSPSPALQSEPTPEQRDDFSHLRLGYALLVWCDAKRDGLPVAPWPPDTTNKNILVRI